MTRDQVLALARMICELDGVALGDPVQVTEGRGGSRSDGRVWNVHSNFHAMGHNAFFVIDDDTGAVLNKRYVGFGSRPSAIAAEFVGDTHSPELSIIERELFVPAARDDVFALLVDAAQVAAISSPVLELVSPVPCKLEAGNVIDWRFRAGGRGGKRHLRLRVDEVWENERIDESQLEGPFRQFRHVMVLVDAGGGTLLRERIAYRSRLGAELLGLRRALEETLELRYAALSRRWGPPWPGTQADSANSNGVAMSSSRYAATREHLQALSQLVLAADGFQPKGPVRAFETTRSGRRREPAWSIEATIPPTGQSARLLIDAATGVVLSKQYIGFGRRPSSDVREFFGNLHRYESSIIEREMFIPAARSEVFAFLVNSANVAAISSPALALASPAGVFEVGHVIDWRLRAGRRERRCKIRVDELRREERIAESQVEGPFRQFRHVLVFADTGGATLLRERIEYHLPGGAWGELGDMVFGVHGAIEDALQLRYVAISRHFGSPWPPRRVGRDEVDAPFTS